MHNEFDLISSDGTRLTAWKNSTTDGTPVLICNGMAVPPEAWPRLLAADCPYQVAGWNHRGALGSDRPTDESAVHIHNHVDDALALLDHMGWDKAIVLGWSLGVNVAYELARRAPERVSGLLGVAGVPGGTFDTLFSPQFVPRRLRKPLGKGAAKLGKSLAPGLNVLARNLPMGRPFAEILRFSGIVLPHADHKDVERWADSMFRQDFDWYFHLALGLAEHEELDPSFLQCPVTVVAGSMDFLTAGEDVLRSASRIPHAEVHQLPGTHCLPLEFPDEISNMLADLIARAAWQESLAAARMQAGLDDRQLPDDTSPFDEPDIPTELIDVRDPDFLRATGRESA